MVFNQQSQQQQQRSPIKAGAALNRRRRQAAAPTCVARAQDGAPAHKLLVCEALHEGVALGLVARLLRDAPAGRRRRTGEWGASGQRAVKAGRLPPPPPGGTVAVGCVCRLPADQLGISGLCRAPARLRGGAYQLEVSLKVARLRTLPSGSSWPSSLRGMAAAAAAPAVWGALSRRSRLVQLPSRLLPVGDAGVAARGQEGSPISCEGAREKLSSFSPGHHMRKTSFCSCPAQSASGAHRQARSAAAPGGPTYLPGKDSRHQVPADGAEAAEPSKQRHGSGGRSGGRGERAGHPALQVRAAAAVALAAVALAAAPEPSAPALSGSASQSLRRA